MAFSFDFFISYAKEEQAWVEQHLLPVFHAANRKCANMTDIQGLQQPLLSEMKQYICGSQKILLVISPDYVSTQASHIITLCYQHYGDETHMWPVIPIIVRPAALPTPLETLVSLDFSHPEQIAANVSRLLDKRQLLTPLPASNREALPDIYSPRYKKLSEYLRLLQKQHGHESKEVERFRLEALIDRVQSILRRLSY